eukprot:651368-Rhodomonas_salina.1
MYFTETGLSCLSKRGRSSWNSCTHLAAKGRKGGRREEREKGEGEKAGEGEKGGGRGGGGGKVRAVFVELGGE